jgi:hypothetical protein
VLTAAFPTIGSLLMAACQSARGLAASDDPVTPAQRGEEEIYEWKRFRLGVGAQLVATVDTTLRVDSPTLGVGTEIDLESDFNVDDRLFLGRVDADWWFAKRHALDFSAFKISREGTRVTNRDIQIGDVVFPVDTEVTSESDLAMVKLAYRYAFLYRPRWRAGASLGVHTVNWNSSWTAGALALDEEFDYTIPLPVIGVFAAYAITPRLFLDASSEFFSLEYEEYDGFVNNTRVNLEHHTFEHVGFGVGLDYFLVNASAENESGSLSAETEFDYIGLLVYLRVF